MSLKVICEFGDFEPWGEQWISIMKFVIMTNLMT